MNDHAVLVIAATDAGPGELDMAIVELAIAGQLDCAGRAGNRLIETKLIEVGDESAEHELVPDQASFFGGGRRKSVKEIGRRSDGRIGARIAEAFHEAL